MEDVDNIDETHTNYAMGGGMALSLGTAGVSLLVYLANIQNLHRLVKYKQVLTYSLSYSVI